MCGIIGYIGKEIVDQKLVNLLKNLEYRGYDSAGIAMIEDENIVVNKTTGKIANLENILKKSNKSTCGIAHTRWATHGKATYNNTHPHLSTNKEWAIVHNGIIENFIELKNTLKNNPNISFKGETDTEVIANLLEVNKKDNRMQTLINTCKLLKGSFALACINKYDNDTLYLAKNKSPLYVANCRGEIIVASDPICFLNFSLEYYSLNDLEFCKVAKEKIEFFDKNGNTIKKEPSKLNILNFSYGKKEYPYFMLKEIDETPEVLMRITKTYKDTNVLKKFNKQFIKEFNNIILVGCGTAYHASLMGAKLLEEICGIQASAHIASEFRYSRPIIDKNTLCIFVSQSGETADTLAACELAKKHNAYTIALTNVLYSSLAKMVDLILPVCAGPEIAVASTKAYTAQTAIFYMLASQIKNTLTNKKTNYVKHVENLAKKLKPQNIKTIQKIADELKDKQKAFFIGRVADYLTCEEASLKLKEISYINCSSHPAGELKHGFLALIESGTYVFVVATKKDLLDKTLNGAHEALARGAKVILVSNIKIKKEKYKDFYKFIKLQNFKEYLMPAVAIIFFQYLAYFTSLYKGLNPDQPRNLAKSVTVE